MSTKTSGIEYSMIGTEFRQWPGGRRSAILEPPRLPRPRTRERPMASSTEHTPRPVALITGASSGIGKVFAQRLAAGGHDLLLVARDGVRLQQVADELSLQYGINAETMPADLARDEGMRSVANRISQTDRLDYPR